MLKHTLTCALIFLSPWVLAQPWLGDTRHFVASELERERVVRGAPYCADAFNESIQPLADGNRIVKRQTTRLCRDGEGRMRQEVERDGRRTVYLRDPVARENWVLDPERKTARRLLAASSDERDTGLDPNAWRDYAERMREWARGMADRPRDGAGLAPGFPPAPPAPIAPAPMAPTAPTAPIAPTAPGPVMAPPGPGSVRSETRVSRTGGHGTPPSATLHGPGVLASLGTREIEGQRASGERTTWTIEAGKLGNERPILITREVWTIPELMLTVLTRDFDPRSGEVSYRLQNLERGEPDPALMRVPFDFDQQRGLPRPPTPATRG